MPSYMIVGASRGLGYAWLEYLSQDPANTVIGLARTPTPVEENLARDGIKNIHIIPGDMASHSSLTTAAELAEPLLPNGLDVLIVNGAYNSTVAAYVPPTAFASASQAQVLHDETHKSLDVNVLGTVYSINAFLPLVMKGSVKKIVVISTGLADAEMTVFGDGNPLMLTYSAMKAALNMVVAKFTAELKSEGLITLLLSPGVVNTKAPETKEELKSATAMFAAFKKVAPHWKGPLTPIESVELQKKVIDGLTIEDSGKFLSHWGNKEWL